MFEDRKIKMLEKHNKELRNDNEALNKEITSLKEEIASMQGVVAAADLYREEHQKMMLDLGECKAQYEIAYKKMLATKKDYEARMERLLKELE